MQHACIYYLIFLYVGIQVVVEIPYIFFQASVYCLLVYAMIGFEWTAEKFFWYLFFSFFAMLYFTFYGMMTVAVTPNNHIASIISAAFYGVWNLFSGFILPRTVRLLSSFFLFLFNQSHIHMSTLLCKFLIT